jgi:hypothetical protein
MPHPFDSMFEADFLHPTPAHDLDEASRRILRRREHIEWSPI